VKHRRILNYQLLLLFSGIDALAAGLFMPFWIIFIQEFGGSIESFGIAVGLMALAGALTSYFVGRHSDVLGRKPFLVTAEVVMAAIMVTYTLITELWQLYALQVASGIVTAMTVTMGQTLLADNTVRGTRGKDVGRFNALGGVVGAFAMMGGGYLAGELGIKVIFYVTASLMLLAGLAASRIREE
jgi:MFS family permease